jgi:predicted acetyltransferase
MSIEVRALHTAEERLAALRLFRSAMVGLPALSDDDAMRLVATGEPGRAFGAFHEGLLIGTTESYAGTLTVPGGVRLPHAAVTHVGVKPSWSRRGVAKALLERQLREARAGGDVLASLRASTGGLYGRFGYGVATFSATIEIDTRQARLRVRAQPEAVELVPPGAEWDTMRHVYRRHPPSRAGAISRPDYWWTHAELRQRGSATPVYVAAHAGVDGPDGYVRYRAGESDGWFSDRQRTLIVEDFVAESAQTAADLLGYLLSLDIAQRIVFPSAPVDEPLGWLLENCRDARVCATSDETWLRILDTRAALEARRYGRAEGAAVIEVVDPLLDGNGGRFRVSAHGAEPASEPAQALLGVDTLAALFLGGVRWWQMVRAGRVEVRDAHAIDVLDALFACEPAPFCGTRF